MNIKISIPYEPDEKDSKVPMSICVEPSVNKSSDMVWFVKFDGDGVKYLNYWLGSKKHDEIYKEFFNVADLILYLTNVKKDVEAAWKKYNERCKYIEPTFDTLKKLFSQFEWEKEN